jgi:catechol 2,3-dioxygenase
MIQIKELGHVVLYVSNLARSADFYRDILGFREILREPGQGIALYSSGRTHHEMLLIEVGGTAPEHRGPKPGLYHIGFKIGDGPEAARQVFAELREKGVPIVGTSDHGITHSIYVLDPDGNELELYADVSDAWKTDPKAIIGPIKPLDLE